MCYFRGSRVALFRFIAAIGALSLVLVSAQADPQKVTIVKDEKKYQLHVGGEPYQVNGVGYGTGSEGKLVALKRAGGNTFRTWGVRTLDKELVLASELGLMVAVGLETGKQLQGFDYDDEAAVARQHTKMTAIIDKYKDHPNVLCWVIANEPNLFFDKHGKLAEVNPKVYKALGALTDYIHKADPNHPVTIAFSGANPDQIKTALAHAPNIDIISLQLYGGLSELGRDIEKLDIDKPIMITEFGPTGHWEMPSTEWGREIEEPSAIKAIGVTERVTKSIINDQTGKVIGSFAFLWGQKQERTPTWYGMFNASGEQTARIDELAKIWTGTYPVNRAPLSYAITINGRKPESSVYLMPGEKARAKVIVNDPDGDTLITEWQFMQEIGLRSQGGHHEDVPKTLRVNVLSTKSVDGGVEIEFTAPKRKGEYRLFSYSYDQHNHVANANIPFMVKK